MIHAAYDSGKRRADSKKSFQDVQPENIPKELKVLNQWVCWRSEQRNGKLTKTPYSPDGKLAKVNDPKTWASYQSALDAYQASDFSGIGVVLTPDDDLVGVDLDKCLDPATGELDPLAAEIIAGLPTYCEISPSGQGLRLFCYGKLPQGRRRKGGIEMYEDGRYLTVTGNRFNGHAGIAKCTAELATAHAKIFGKPRNTTLPTADLSAPGDFDDRALLDKASKAKNGLAFDALWRGDLSAHSGDHSAADLALCNKLAFWTGNDTDRIDRLFRQSGLMRSKWDEIHSPTDGKTYGAMTIDAAISGCHTTYSGRELKVTFTPASGSSWRQIHENAKPVIEKFSLKSSQSSQSSQSITYKFPTHHKVITNPSQSHHQPITVEAPLLETEKERGVATIIDSKAAQLLAGTLSGRLAFCRDTQLWHGFTGTHWQPFFSPAVAEDLVTQLVYAGTPNVGFEARYLNSLIGLLRRGLLPMPEPVESNLIPFANGLLNPATRALTPITPENAPTWSLPYAYSPSADCPTIKAWLKKAVGNDGSSVEFLRAWLAALLTGRADLQKFLHLIGPGGTGKGTFIRLAKALVGDANAVVTDLRSLEQNRFETAALYGKRLAAITDTSRYGGSVDVFKALTGQDPLRLERKHQQQTATFQFEGLALLASNEAIQTSDLTGALERRRLTVRFEYVASDEERRLWDTQGGESAVLHHEIPGLVNWLLDLSRDDVTRLITQRPARVEAANLEALRASNAVADWMMDNLIPDSSARTQVGTKIENRQSGMVCFEHADTWLYPNYLRWCQQHGREALSLTRFSGLILDVGRVLGKNLTKDRDRYGAHVKGLRLAREEDFTTCDDLTRHWVTSSLRVNELQVIDYYDCDDCDDLEGTFIPMRARAREETTPITSANTADPLATRILNLLQGSPAGFSQEEITRQCGNGKGASPTMIELALTRLTKEGVTYRVNGRWVARE